MGTVRYKGLLQVGDMHTALGFQVQPAVAIPDIMNALKVEGLGGSSGFKFHALHNCACAAPLLIPHNQRVVSGVSVIDNDAFLLAGAPALRWSLQVRNRTTNAALDPSKYAVQMFDAPHLKYQLFDVQLLDESLAATARLVADCSTYERPEGGGAQPLAAQDILIGLSRTLWTGIAGAGTAAGLIRLDATVGTDVYRIELVGANPPRVLISGDSGLSWREIKGELLPGGALAAIAGDIGQGPAGGGLEMRLTVLNGRLSLTVGGGQAPFVTPLRAGAGASARITRITLTVDQWTQVGGGAHPLMFVAQPTFTSQLHQLGFVPHESTPPFYLVHTSGGAKKTDSAAGLPLSEPARSSVRVTTVPETMGTAAAQYQLMLNNPLPVVGGEEADAYDTFGGVPYSCATVALGQVTVKVRGFEAAATPAWTNIPLGLGGAHPVMAVQEDVSFNPGALTIGHSALITLQNFRGIAHLGAQTGIAGIGNVAVAFRLGYHHQPDPDPGFPGYARFLGFCQDYEYQRGVGGAATLVLSCVDEQQKLADSLIAAPPIMDGWNHYYAVSFLLQQASIPVRRMAFSAFVPEDPYADSPGGAPDGDYHLPLGDGGRPWTPINRTLSVLELLDTIRKLTGYLLFIDEHGRFRYEPWIPASPAAPKRIFTEVAPPGGADASGGLTEMWNLRSSLSTRDVRNQLVLVGIDAYGDNWVPIVTKREDAASISSPPGSQPKNYVGYRKSMVFMDSRFARADFASSSATRLFRWLRQPSAVVSFTTWMQPDLYPMDVIYVNDAKSGIQNIPYYVLNMSNTLSLLGGRIAMQSQITARYFDPTLVGG